MRRTVMAVAVVGVLCAALVLAQTPANKSVMFGTWKLDVAKSKFSPGPPLKSQVAKLLEVQNVPGQAQRPLADLRRLARSLSGQVSFELRFERRQQSVQQIEQPDPVLVFVES